jgi:hypothetical protein
MNDEESGFHENEKRPNAKYNLSNPDDKNTSEEGLTFYYNRERRLASAPKEVQNLYKEHNPTRFGVFKSLVADKPRRILFFSIILLCILIFTISRLGFFETKHILDGNRIDITGTRFEGTTIIRLRKIVENANAYTGAVDIFVFVAGQQPAPPSEQPGEEPLVFSRRIFFTLDREQEDRFVVPFNSSELIVVLESERSTLHIRLNPE